MCYEMGLVFQESHSPGCECRIGISYFFIVLLSRPSRKREQQYQVILFFIVLLSRPCASAEREHTAVPKRDNKKAPQLLERLFVEV